eukprot:7204325-Prymnesium_polylepis.1
MCCARCAVRGAWVLKQHSSGAPVHVQRRFGGALRLRGAHVAVQPLQRAPLDVLVGEERLGLGVAAAARWLDLALRCDVGLEPRVDAHVAHAL